MQNTFVFLTEANKPFTDAFLRKKFAFLFRLAGLKQRSPKQFRHTFATQAISLGENITWVSHTLGHSSIEITAKRYNRYVQNLTRKDGSLLAEKRRAKSSEPFGQLLPMRNIDNK